MKTICFGAAILFAAILSTDAQSAIAYVNGPVMTIPANGYGNVYLDFGHKGAADFGFSSTVFICTTDIPITACGSAFLITSQNTNEVACQADQALILTAGTVIGGSFTNASWKVSPGATIVPYSFSQRFGTSGWGGVLGQLGQGYLGVRFYASDGQHYGWVHVTLTAQLPGFGDPVPVFVSPTIIDWAYETNPNTPIIAGAVTSAPLAAPQLVRAENFRLRWQSQPGIAYKPQFKGQLSASGWNDLDFTVIATATNSIVDVPLTGEGGYYRVVRVE